MCSEPNTTPTTTPTSFACCRKPGAQERLTAEFQHLQSDWWWLFLFGILLVTCGSLAVIFPILAATGAVVALGILLTIGGVATIVTSLWAGKWSGMLLQILVGILYLVAGLTIGNHPALTEVAATLCVATLFIVVGLFRCVAALMIQFPHWGWALLNGILTFLLGMIICRSYIANTPVILGLLIGIEMFFHGWMWMALGLAIRNLPAPKA